MLKNLFSSVFMILLFVYPAFSQNVAINADGSPPNSNAMLDIQSPNKGILIPRLSTSARLAIPNTKGLLVYDTTTSAFWYNTGAGWQSLGAGASGWSLNGNTIDSNSFIGPVNYIPFKVKINNQLSALIDPRSNNVSWGYQVGLPAGYSDTANTAIGGNAMQSLRKGQDNTVVGANALARAYRCDDNTAMGQLALYYDTTGSYNTAIGAGTLFQTTTGAFNTALGEWALANNFTGTYNTGLGYAADVSGRGLTNATAIGAGALVNASNKVRIGNSAVTVIEGQVPFTTPSDGRFKFDVQEDVKGLDFIRQLRPVTYHFDTERFEKACAGRSGSGSESRSNMNAPMDYTMQAAYKQASLIRRSGFIAQEVEQAAQASGYNFSGIIRPGTAQEHYSLSYESFVVPLVKAVQEQQQLIEQLKKQNDRLEQRLTELEKKLKTKNLGGAARS
jgi:hypothetical protein